MKPVASSADMRWVWVVRPSGGVYLCSTDRLPVMDFVRKSMQACVPRFPNWPGVMEGQPRNGVLGVMSMAASWFDEEGRVAHPYARLIEASPALHDALERAHSKLAAAIAAGKGPSVLKLVKEAHAIQAGALAELQGAAS